MTTGLYNQWNTAVIGPMAYKSWSGLDWPKADRPKVGKFRDLPPIVDPWGHSVSPKDGIMYVMAMRAAKGKLLRQQQVATRSVPDLHTYTKSHNKGLNGPVTNTVTHVTNPYIQFFGSYSALDTWSSNDDIKLIEKLREKILGSDLSTGVAVAEADKALLMLRSNLKNLTWGLTALRKGDLKAAFSWLLRGDRARKEREISPLRGLPKGVAGTFLWWQYGIKPLIDDSDALLRFVAHETAAGVPVGRYKVSRSIPLNVVPSYAPAGSDPQFSFGYSSAAITAYVTELSVPTLVGLYDIPGLVYERIPYSFVLDWAIPVGSYLNALLASRALTGKFCTTRKRYTQWRPLNNQFAIGGEPWVGAKSTWVCQFWISRSVSTNLNVPFPSIKPARQSISRLHAAEAAALLINKMKFLV